MDNFNHAAAKAVYDVISKMDDDSALVFSRILVRDMVYGDIENNRRAVDSYAQEIMEDIERDVVKAFSGTAVEEDVFELVSKVDPWAHGDPDWVKRDRRGRFSRTSSANVNIGGTNYQAKIKNKGKGKKVVLREQKPGQQPRNIDVAQALSSANKKGNAFAQKWTEQTDGRTNQQTYNRIQAGSQLMRDVGMATGNPNLALAGTVGAYAGALGPSAEQVIGPSMRRTAYRYRGTERPVDSQLTRNATRMIAADMQEQRATPASYSAEDRMEQSTAAAASYLMSRLPDKKWSEIQRQSGKMPPSEGVIINSEGKIITQAVGYQEDHFLPFNLKNLKGLNGGSYVRTRSSGGLTSEDIYTGLMSNARSVTVVSRSGVFTIDFADDFRGQRRYSDKATQMVNRYEKTLDAIQSETINRRSLDPAERVAIREEVEREYSWMADTWEGRQEMENLIKEREKQYKASAHLTRDEIEEIDAKAKEAAKNPNIRTGSAVGPGDRAVGGVGGRPQRMPDTEEGRYKVIRAELISNALDDKQARNYRLDGEGYAAALEALREQYPYYIENIRYQARAEGIGASREKDSGYVSPGANRPNAVREGYFGTEPGKSNKFSASETNYQRRKDAPFSPRKEEGSTETSTATSGVSAGAPKRPESAAERQRSSMSRVKAEQTLAGVAATAAGFAMAEPTVFPALNKINQIDGSTDERNQKIADLLNDSREREAVMREINTVKSRLRATKEPSSTQAAEELDAGLKTYRQMMSMASNRAFDRDSYRSSPDSPYRFDDVAPGRPREEYARQFQMLVGATPEGASDSGLKRMATAHLHQADAYEEAARGEVDIQRALDSVNRLNVDENTASQFAQMLEMIAERGDTKTAKDRAATHRAQAAKLEKARAVLQEYSTTQQSVDEKERKANSSNTSQRTLSQSPRTRVDTKLADLRTLQAHIDREGDENDLIAIDEMVNYAQNVANGDSDVEDVRSEFRENWARMSPRGQQMAARFLGGSVWDMSDDD